MNIPTLIYLQVNPEDEYYEVKNGPFPSNDKDVTWCRDKLNDSDIPYIRAAAAQKAVKAIDRGLYMKAKRCLQECLKGGELADDPYLARQFLKDKLNEIEAGEYELVADIIREMRDYFNL